MIRLLYSTYAIRIDALKKKQIVKSFTWHIETYREKNAKIKSCNCHVNTHVLCLKMCTAVESVKMN